MINKIYDFSDYRSFLLDYLKSQPKKGHGIRSQWSKVIGCQIAFVSHVLNGRYELSLEQAEALARHLALNRDEFDFFLLLVQKSRSGSHQLKLYYQKLIKERLQAREQVQSRLQINNNMTLEDQAIYYSSWIYSAIHMLLTVPQFQNSPEKISNYFSVPLEKVREVLEFLETRSIISHSGGKYIVNQSFIFIHKDSPLFSHQQNFWRQKAIESVYENKPEHLHFASIFTVSEKDLKKIKEVLLKSIEDTTEIIKPSKEEKLYSICMDLFEVK